MTSKKPKPLASLFQQWSSQSQQQEETSSAQQYVPQSSYRILLQSTHGLATRIQAAEAVENPQVYKRAGVPTPAETAMRDSQGGYAWLEYLVELARKHNHLIWVATTSQPSPITTKLISLSNADENANVTVLNAAVDPWGWDDESKVAPSLQNLEELHDQLSNLIQQKSSAVLAWESLTPLIVAHGFELSHLFLTRFESCMQLWPIRIELLTPFQHSILEDDAQALLHLKGGEMTMLRQGVRERGNILRQTMPFRLEGGKLVELEVEDPSASPDEEVTDKTPATDKTSPSPTPSPTTVAARPGSSRKIQLKMEEEDEHSKTEHSKTETSVPNRPRIYLQDDDPEFDDMDEEDPDDDLDI